MENVPAKPKVVCLCGSTKFRAAFEAAQVSETLAGRIVLTVACFTHHDGLSFTEEEKRIFDAMHLRKIDLADEILVIDVGGYVGESARREIDYARARGKAVRWLEGGVNPVSGAGA